MAAKDRGETFIIAGAVAAGGGVAALVSRLDEGVKEPYRSLTMLVLIAAGVGLIAYGVRTLRRLWLATAPEKPWYHFYHVDLIAGGLVIGLLTLWVVIPAESRAEIMSGLRQVYDVISLARGRP